MIGKYVGYRKVPYYSQKSEFLFKEGSLNNTQIQVWENNLCGLMCASMIVNQFRSGSKHTVAELLSNASKIEAFHRRSGWIHKKIVALLGEYGIKGTCQTIDTLSTVYNLLERDILVMASVSPNYLRPELNVTDKRNGHLVVVVGMRIHKPGYQLFIHDPSSEFSEGGKNLVVDSGIFERSFSGNIIAFKNPGHKIVRTEQI